MEGWFESAGCRQRAVDADPAAYASLNRTGPGRPIFPRGEHAALPIRSRALIRHLEHENLFLDRSSIAVGESVTVSVDVTNVSDREADEVAQLYIHQRHVTASRPVREFKAFERVTVEAVATRTVTFTLGSKDSRADLAERLTITNP